MELLRLPTVLLLLGCLAPTAARAEPDPPVAPAAAAVREMLVELATPAPDAGWLVRQVAHFRISGKHGLSYTRWLHMGSRPLRLRVGGPAVGRGGVGLAVELRF